MQIALAYSSRSINTFYKSSFQENNSDDERENYLRQKSNRLALGLRMVMIVRIAEWKAKMRMGNSSPTITVSMVKKGSRNVIAQEENYQHPFSYFHQLFFHLIKISAKVSILFVFTSTLQK